MMFVVKGIRSDLKHVIGAIFAQSNGQIRPIRLRSGHFPRRCWRRSIRKVIIISHVIISILSWTCCHHLVVMMMMMMIIYTVIGGWNTRRAFMAGLYMFWAHITKLSIIIISIVRFSYFIITLYCKEYPFC